MQSPSGMELTEDSLDELIPVKVCYASQTGTAQVRTRIEPGFFLFRRDACIV